MWNKYDQRILKKIGGKKMPNRDGTGPRGQGAGQGFGLGRGLVAGRRLMGRFFPGSSGGFCKCPKCGKVLKKIIDSEGVVYRVECTCGYSDETFM